MGLALLGIARRLGEDDPTVSEVACQSQQFDSSSGEAWILSMHKVESPE